MPRDITVKLYKFNELSEEAKERAREWWREGMDDSWHEPTIEDAKTCLAFAGFDIREILYTGFWSQGDGACFTGTWAASDVKDPRKMKSHAPVDTELHAFADEMFAIKKLCRQASATLKHDGRYYHEHTIDFEFDFPERIEGTKADEIETRVKECSRRAMKWVYSQLEKDYEFQTSNEQIDEAITINEYEFYETGKIYVKPKEKKAAS